MAEETGQERTEEATPRRRQQAQEKGQVPRSRELTTTMLLLGGTAGLMLFSSFMLEGLLALFREGFALDRQPIFLRDAGLWQLGRLQVPPRSCLHCSAPFFPACGPNPRRSRGVVVLRRGACAEVEQA